jgi:Domain of unknown function (DUF4394)
MSKRFVLSLLLVACAKKPAPEEIPTPVPSPQIVVFTASKNALPTSGGEVTLTWSTLNADRVRIDPAPAEVQANGTHTLTVTETTTFTLSAKSSADETVAQTTTVTVRAPVPPSIVSFKASPSTLATWRAESTLSWVVDGADAVYLDQDLGLQTGNERTVRPTATTSYTLVATNAFGSSTASVILTVPERVRGTRLILLSADGRIAFTETNNPDLQDTVFTPTGIAMGETLRAIDVRPMNGRLYGVTTDGSGNVRLYHIGLKDHQATPLSVTPLHFDPNGVTLPVTGTDFDMEFLPDTDRVRVVTDTGFNFRMNPNNGALVDGDLSTSGVSPDAAITGGTVGAIGATNNVFSAAFSTLYSLGANGLSLHGGEDGVQTIAHALMIDGAPAFLTGVRAFDIADGVDAESAGAQTRGQGFAWLTVGGSPGIFSVNLDDGALVRLGDTGEDLGLLSDVCVFTPRAVGIGLSAGQNLVRFDLTAPTQVTTVAVTGVASGEVLVGIEFRPSTGQLMGLGIDETSDSGTLYLLDPLTAVATRVSVATGAIRFVNESNAVVPLSLASEISFSANTDRVRVVDINGNNYRVSAFNGAPVDGTTGTAFMNMDVPLSGDISGGDGIASIESTGDVAAEGTIALSSTSDALAFASGNASTGNYVQAGLLGLNVAARSGTSGAALADGDASTVYGAFTVANITSLYLVAPSIGAATHVATIGTGTFALWGLATAVPHAAEIRLLRR